MLRFESPLWLLVCFVLSESWHLKGMCRGTSIEHKWSIYFLTFCGLLVAYLITTVCRPFHPKCTIFRPVWTDYSPFNVLLYAVIEKWLNIGLGSVSFRLIVILKETGYMQPVRMSLEVFVRILRHFLFCQLPTSTDVHCRTALSLTWSSAPINAVQYL